MSSRLGEGGAYDDGYHDQKKKFIIFIATSESAPSIAVFQMSFTSESLAKISKQTRNLSGCLKTYFAVRETTNECFRDCAKIEWIAFSRKEPSHISYWQI